MAAWGEFARWAKSSLLDDYFRVIDVASEKRELEVHSAVLIQRVFRGYKTRQRLERLLAATLLIQRVYRGHLGRRRVRRLRKQAHVQRQRMFFDHAAKQIQKLVRGVMVRKYVCDYYARRREIVEATLRSQAVKAEAEMYATTVRTQQQQTELEQLSSAFASATGALHHLISTAAQPGVYSAAVGLTQPEAFGEPVEDHLRRSLVGKLRRTKRPLPASALAAATSASGATTGGTGTLLAPVNPPSPMVVSANPAADVMLLNAQERRKRAMGPFKPAFMVESMKSRALNLTLQASTPYAVVDEAARDERHTENKYLQQIQAVPFQQVRKPEPLHYERGVIHPEPFIGAQRDRGDKPKLLPFLTTVKTHVMFDGVPELRKSPPAAPGR